MTMIAIDRWSPLVSRKSKFEDSSATFGLRKTRPSFRITDDARRIIRDFETHQSFDARLEHIFQCSSVQQVCLGSSVLTNPKIRYPNLDCNNVDPQLVLHVLLDIPKLAQASINTCISYISCNTFMSCVFCISPRAYAYARLLTIYG